MKITIDIPDALLREARRLATRERATLKDLVEQGLRRVIVEHEKKIAPFRLLKASFKGEGLQPGVHDAGCERPCDVSYDGRGG